MKELTIEEFEKNVLKLNGTMTTKVFASVMKRLKRKEYLQCNSGEDNQNDVDVHNYLGVIGKDKVNKDYTEHNFPTMKAFFRYKNIRFIWEVIFGQGSHCLLYIDKNVYQEDKQIEIKEIDTGLKFYKVV